MIKNNLQKIILYLSIVLVPFIFYPFSINGAIIFPRTIREIAFFSFAIIMLALLQKNIWLRLFTVWCVIGWWLNFFIPTTLSYMGLVNIFSALMIYTGFKYFIKEKIVNSDVLLKIIAGMCIFQFLYLMMQKFLNFDPFFQQIATQEHLILTNQVPLVGFSGHPALLGLFFCITSFLLLEYFRFKKIPVLFLILIPAFLLVRSATVLASFSLALLFYISIRYKNLKIVLISLAFISIFSFLYLHFLKPVNITRFEIWKHLFQDGIKLRPFVGSGVNHFAGLVIKGANGTIYGEAHNEYLQMIFELGLVGFSLFTAFIVSKFIEFFKFAKTNKQYCIAACLVAFLLEGIGYFPMHLAQTGFIAILLLVCLESSYEAKIL